MLKALPLLALLALAPEASAAPPLLAQATSKVRKPKAPRQKKKAPAATPTPAPAPELQPAPAPPPPDPTPVPAEAPPLELIPLVEPLTPSKPAAPTTRPAPKPKSPAASEPLLPEIELEPLAPQPEPEPEPTPQVAAPAASSTPVPGLLFAAPKVGASKATNALPGALFLAAEVGVRLPVLEQRLALVAQVSYHQPGLQGSLGNSPDAGYRLTQSEVVLGLSAVYRLESSALTPYGGLGPGLYLRQARVEYLGSPYVESRVDVGVQLLAGAEYRLGPGGVFAEAHYHLTGAEPSLTGSAQLSSWLVGSAGYRLHW